MSTSRKSRGNSSYLPSLQGTAVPFFVSVRLTYARFFAGGPSIEFPGSAFTNCSSSSDYSDEGRRLIGCQPRIFGIGNRRGETTRSLSLGHFVKLLMVNQLKRSRTQRNGDEEMA